MGTSAMKISFRLNSSTGTFDIYPPIVAPNASNAFCPPISTLFLGSCHSLATNNEILDFSTNINVQIQPSSSHHLPAPPLQ